MRIKNYTDKFDVVKEGLKVKNTDKLVGRYSFIIGLFRFIFGKSAVACTDRGSIVFIKKADLQRLGEAVEPHQNILDFKTDAQWNQFFTSLRNRASYIPVPRPPAHVPAPVAPAPAPVPVPAPAPVAAKPHEPVFHWHPINELYDPSRKAWVNPYEVQAKIPNGIYKAAEFDKADSLESNALKSIRRGRIPNVNDQSANAKLEFERVAKIKKDVEADFKRALYNLIGYGTRQEVGWGTADLKTAADKGHSKASLIFALLLDRRWNDKEFTDLKSNIGLNRFHTRQEAVLYYLKKAAEAGELEAQVLLGDLLVEDRMSWYAKAAAGDDPHPGACYIDGLRLMREKPGEAYANFEIAADAGHVGALYQLGLALHYGKGVKQNIEGAIGKYLEAFHKDSDEATYQLAILLHEYPKLKVVNAEGQLETASSLLYKAAIKGYAPACYQYLSMIKRGEVLPEDEGELKDYLFNQLAGYLPEAEIEWLKREMQAQ